MNKSNFIESYKNWEKSKGYEEFGQITESDRHQEIKEWLSNNTNYNNRTDILKYITNYALYEIYEPLNKLFTYLKDPEKELLCGALILVSINEGGYIIFNNPEDVMEFRIGRKEIQVLISIDYQVGDQKVDFKIMYINMSDAEHIKNTIASNLIVMVSNDISIKNSRQIKMERYVDSFANSKTDRFKYKNNLPAAKIDELEDGCQVFKFSREEINTNPFKCADIIFNYVNMEYGGISWREFDENHYKMLDGF
jgi:hypothetical protein